ncbi:MAG: cation diffusion facilitator family transporter [Bacteroidota bacterium]
MTRDRIVGGNTGRARENRLITATVLNFVITIAEVIGGLLSNSLALLSDALHNLGDTVAVFIAWIANKVSKKGTSGRQTFGYKRVEILAALFNAVVLVVISIYLFIEALERLKDPQPVKGLIMFIVATVGFIANLVAVFILHKDSSYNINVRAAYLHLLGDTISSVAVIVGSIFIYFWEVYWIDPVVTFLIGIYILRETYSILKETVNILMQGSPYGMDIQTMKHALEKLEGVENIHHIHLWSLSDQQVHFECHMDLNKDYVISEADRIREEAVRMLKKEFHVQHVTIQVEYGRC